MSTHEARVDNLAFYSSSGFHLHIPYYLPFLLRMMDFGSLMGKEDIELYVQHYLPLPS